MVGMAGWGRIGRVRLEGQFFGVTTLKITTQMIEASKSPSGGWDKNQLKLIGVPWPPPKGWKSEVVKIEHDAKSIEMFIAWHKKTPNG